MKTVGLLISQKNGEKRRALLPAHLGAVKNVQNLLFEVGYGNSLGISDDEYRMVGAKFGDRSEVLKQDVIVDVKLGDATYLDELEPGRILFGWAHATQKTDFTSKAMTDRHTVYAWEELYEDGRYIFYRNREIAGEAGVLHAFPYCGRMPYDARVAVLGNGQTARGALRVLFGLGAEVDVYDYPHEKLFRKNMFDYDVIVNCVLWDTSRTDRLIYKDDLKHFRKGTMIIDISCDPELEIETSKPTTIADPVYEVDGVIHYAVDNTPAMFSVTVSKILSSKMPMLIDQLVSGQIGKILEEACVVEQGRIIRQEIIDFRKRLGLPV